MAHLQGRGKAVSHARMRAGCVNGRSLLACIQGVAHLHHVATAGAQGHDDALVFREWLHILLQGGLNDVLAPFAHLGGLTAASWLQTQRKWCENNKHMFLYKFD
jgi:hypothetical protein